MNIKKKWILRIGSLVLIFHFRFKTSKKIIVWSGWDCNIKIFYLKLPRRRRLCAIFLILYWRDVRNQAGIADFLNFGIKFRNSVFRHLREIMRCVLWRFINLRIGISSGNHSFPEEDYSKKPKDKLWLNQRNGFWFAKVLVDNSSAVEGFGEEAKAVWSKNRKNSR
jgi:hypothetical protein